MANAGCGGNTYACLNRRDEYDHDATRTCMVQVGDRGDTCFCDGFKQDFAQLHGDHQIEAFEKCCESHDSKSHECQR